MTANRSDEFRQERQFGSSVRNDIMVGKLPPSARLNATHSRLSDIEGKALEVLVSLISSIIEKVLISNVSEADGRVSWYNIHFPSFLKAPVK
jgi:hypothetical protein